MQAAKHGRLPELQALLEAGADITRTTNDGSSVLDWAVMGGHIPVWSLPLYLRLITALGLILFSFSHFVSLTRTHILAPYATVSDQTHNLSFKN